MGVALFIYIYASIKPFSWSSRADICVSFLFVGGLFLSSCLSGRIGGQGLSTRLFLGTGAVDLDLIVFLEGFFCGEILSFWDRHIEKSVQ